MDKAFQQHLKHNKHSMLAESAIWGALCHCDIKAGLLSSLSSSAALFLVTRG